MKDNLVNQKCAYCEEASIGSCVWTTDCCMHGCGKSYCNKHRTSTTNSHCREIITCTDCEPKLRKFSRNAYIGGLLVLVLMTVILILVNIY